MNFICIQVCVRAVVFRVLFVQHSVGVAFLHSYSFLLVCRATFQGRYVAASASDFDVSIDDFFGDGAGFFFDV